VEAETHGERIVIDEQMPRRVGAEGRATEEFFRLRRGNIVGVCAFLAFVSAFAAAGILGFQQLANDVTYTADWAMFRYIGTMLLSGAGAGLVGMAVGHVIASVWERIDLRINPRRYEQG